ncbi:MAG TPA: rhodanese-like domain-containing protein [Candidatus Binatia bacterium]|jgi:rhodanese-related sulfurtransferase|nr:rhodanese-like domain-containing protein [Candidatus Binatia bacterium]
MTQAIDREEVQRLMEEGCALVEVLPRKEYDRVHLPGAISLPLAELYPFSGALPEKGRPIVVYCYDSQ